MLTLPYYAPFFEKGDNTLASSPSQTPAQLCPLPRDGLRCPTSGSVILHILLFLSTALTGISVCAMHHDSPLPETAVGILIGVLILPLVLHLWRMTSSARILVPLLIVAGGFLTFYTGSIIPAGMLCGVVFTVSEGSLTVALQPKDKLVWLPLIPIAAYILTALLFRDPLGALAVLIPLPAAPVLAWGTRRSAEREDGPTRVGVICTTAVALGLSLVALIALLLFRYLGTLHPTVLSQELDALREGIIQSFLSYEVPEGVDPKILAQWEALMTYANLEDMVNSAINLLPGIVVAGVLILTAACQTVQHAALRTLGFEESITDRVKAFRMSLVSCVVFLVAYLLVSLENSTISSLAGTIAQNICIILMPGLALAGMLRLMRGLAKKGSRGMGCLFFFIILIPCVLIVAPFLLAAVEVIGHIFTSVASALNPPDDDNPFGGSTGGND